MTNVGLLVNVHSTHKIICTRTRFRYLQISFQNVGLHQKITKRYTEYYLQNIAAKEQNPELPLCILRKSMHSNKRLLLPSLYSR